MNEFKVTIIDIQIRPNQNPSVKIQYHTGQTFTFEMEKDEFLKLNCAVGATLIARNGENNMAEIVACTNDTSKTAKDYFPEETQEKPKNESLVSAESTAARLNKIAAEYGYHLFGGISGQKLCMERGYNSLASVVIDVLKHSDEIPVGKKTLSHLKAFVKELRISTKNGFNWLNTCRIGKPVLKPIYWILISQQIKDVQKLNCVSIEQFKEVIEALHPSTVENVPKEMLPDGVYAVTITSCSALKKQLINYHEVIRWELTNLSRLQKLV